MRRLAISEKALGTDQGQKYRVCGRTTKIKVEYRRVKVGMALQDGLRVIDEGLNEGERVVVDGPATGQAGRQGRTKDGGDARTGQGFVRRRLRQASRSRARRRAKPPAAAKPEPPSRPLGPTSKNVFVSQGSRRKHPPCSRDSSSTARSLPRCCRSLITLGGGLAVFNLPLAQYPPVTPPIVRVYCGYPGASAQVVAETVAAPIEQQVNGVENMLYMASQCANDGSYSLAVTFKHGVNLNLAQVLVQNRVNLALPQLPDVLKQTGVTTRKQSPDIVMSVNIYSPHGRYDQLYLSNYALRYIRDELLRLPGVSDVFISGQRDYAMRIWVDPEQARLAEPHGRRRGQRHSRAERAGGLRPDRAAADRPGPNDADHPFDPRPAEDTRSNSRTSSSAPRPTAASFAIKDVARVELGARNQDVTLQARRQAVGRVDDFSVARRQRAGRGRPRSLQRWTSWRRIFPTI